MAPICLQVRLPQCLRRRWHKGCGSCLFRASLDVVCSRVVVWGVALGVGASLQLGLQLITCLEWSPDGACLLAGEIAAVLAELRAA
jgi:hypothetical protein